VIDPKQGPALVPPLPRDVRMNEAERYLASLIVRQYVGGMSTEEIGSHWMEEPYLIGIVLAAYELGRGR
jgi:hypothetical protein